ncbi:MAG: capsular exopolysaccharide family [Dehalococcoidia bacterium]|nr:capsular exopolysaccharide family [Dehalococcoidia bacterium]
MEERGLDLRAYGGILFKWWWVFVVGGVGAALVAYFVSSAMTPIYEATTKVLVQGGQAPGVPTASEVQASERLASNYSDLIKNRPILEGVIRSLSLPYGPATLSGKISVSSPRSLIRITAKDPDPRLAADLANSTAQTFIDDFQDRQFTQIAQFQASLGQYGITQDSSLISAQAATMGTLSIVEGAIPPSAPSSPRTGLNVLLAVLLGLLVAGIVVFVVEYMDDSIKSAEDLGRIAGLVSSASAKGGLSNLGSVMRHRVKAGLFPVTLDSGQEHSATAEAYKYLGLNLEFAALGIGGIKTVLVTSALPGEGKTTTAANLAISLARGGKSVVLVDGDLRKPALHRVFGLENSRGLTNALLGIATLDDVLTPTPVELLKVVTSGPLPPDATMVLRSARMGATIKALADRADVVILDSPPVMVVTDSIVLAPQVDAIIIVLDAQRSGRQALKSAVQSLQQTNTPILGVVFNKVSARGTGYGYYSSYYYGYSENGGGERRSGAPATGALARAFRRVTGRKEAGREG